MNPDFTVLIQIPGLLEVAGAINNYVQYLRDTNTAQQQINQLSSTVESLTQRLHSSGVGLQGSIDSEKQSTSGSSK